MIINKTIIFLLTSLFSFQILAHGVIETPASREQFCGVESKPDEIYTDKMTHEKCRPIMTKIDGSMENSIYNFMAVLSHSVGRSDKPFDLLPKHVCGFDSEMWAGGKTPWDSAMDWPTTVITSGQQKFIWNISWGNHFSDTQEFVYWITKPDFEFNPDKELSWNDFESTPFCKLDYNDQAPNANPNIIPNKLTNRFTTLCNVPERKNRAVIYGEWGRTPSTYERFHSCMDVVFSQDNPIPTTKAVISPIPAEVVGATELVLDASKSLGSNLTYKWSLDAEDISSYKLENSQTAKPRLVLGAIRAQQKVSVNLTVSQGENSNRASTQFLHVPAISASWKMVGKASQISTLKAGDKIQLRLIDTSGKDYLIPSSPLVLTEQSAQPQNWAYALATVVNPDNQFSAKIGVLYSDKKTINPVNSETENRIYVPVNSSIANGFIQLEQANIPTESCLSKRRANSNGYWLGYDVYTDVAPVVLDFSATGIDLTKVGIDQVSVFSEVKVIDKDHLLISNKPAWVSKTVAGYLGFYGPNHGSYEPFNSTVNASCQASGLGN